MIRTGGVGAEQCATDEVKEISEKVRAEAESQAGRKFDMFNAVKFCTQVVAGTNFFIKVQVSDAEYVHLRVYRDLQMAISLAGIQTGKTLEDPIHYF